MKKITIARVNGSKKVNRKVLERNALDCLTMDENTDFEECLAFVEEATIEELKEVLIKAGW